MTPRCNAAVELRRDTVTLICDRSPHPQIEMHYDLSLDAEWVCSPLGGVLVHYRNETASDGHPQPTLRVVQ